VGSGFNFVGFCGFGQKFFVFLGSLWVFPTRVSFFPLCDHMQTNRVFLTVFNAREKQENMKHQEGGNSEGCFENKFEWKRKD
jgi:hypothetical protein